jgi:hypothetical protein
VKASPVAANSLADFWWSWAMRDCFPYLSLQIERFAKLTDKVKIKEQTAILDHSRDSCVQTFIFEHWADVNQSIANKFANFPHDNE